MYMMDFNSDYSPRGIGHPSSASPTPSEGRQCPGKLKPWLIAQIDGGEIKDLSWLDRSKGVFILSWVHKSKENWSEDDAVAKLSMKWAINKGKYREGVDEKSYPKWKQTLRAAFRATGIHELKDSRYPCGENYKIYAIGPLEAPSPPRGSPSSSPRGSVTECPQHDPSLPPIPSVVTDYRSGENLPSDLMDVNSGDLFRKAEGEKSLSIGAAFETCYSQQQEQSMEMSYH